MTTQLDELEAGSRLGGYSLRRKEALEHLQGTFYELIHEKTRATHIHLAVPDENNVFVLTFPTVPTDSTGVAHILEHIVLGGSRKYPIRSPFFSMMPRSLKTTMNASTAADATAYYFATRNKKDYFNLLSVYLDASFFPLITEQTFKQEAHRLEFKRPDDPASGLQFVGIVFNEMKAGNLTAPSRMGRAIGKSLFPDLTYANNSGGDPAVIPELTWEQLRAFHATHYHPSNSFFYTFGDFPLEEILPEIEAHVLAQFDHQPMDHSIPQQKSFERPVEVESSFALGPEEDPNKKSQALIAWKTIDTSNTPDVLAFEVLTETLLTNTAGPLRRALIDSGLGTSLADLSGFNSTYQESVFGAGLNGIEPNDAQRVETIVLETLESVASDGLDPQLVKAALHTVEFREREVSNSGLPYAFGLFLRLMRAFVHGADAHDLLQVERDLEELRSKIAREPFLEQLIHTHLLTNPHRARIVLTPDKELEQRLAREEQVRLAEIEKGLTEKDKGDLVRQATELEQLHEAKQDLSILPNLELTDVPMVFEDVPHKIERFDGTTIGWFPQPTNGISYLQLHCSFSGLPDRLKDLLPFFSYAIVRSGAGGVDYARLATRISLHTGGIEAHPHVRELAGGNARAFRQRLIVAGKALARNHNPFINILRDLLLSLELEPKRLKDLLAESLAGYENAILNAGQRFALSLSSSKLTPSRALGDRLSGVEQLRTIRRLSRFDDLQGLIEDLHEIRKHVLRTGNLDVCVTSEEQQFEQLRPAVTDLLKSLPAGPPDDMDPRPAAPRRHEALVTAVPIVFNAKAFKTVGAEHPDAPVLSVLASYMGTTYTHPEIREKGGAYGGRPTYDRESQLFAFMSWRDPNVARTYEVFEGAVREVIKGDIDDGDLKSAILAACGAADPLLSPDTKGQVRFFDDIAGYTLELKQKYKSGLLKVNVDDLKRVAETYLADGAEAVLTTIGNQRRIEEANAQMGGMFDISAA